MDETILKITDRFLNDNLSIDIHTYGLNFGDYFVDQIILRLDYLKSEYKKAVDAGDFEKSDKVRYQVASIMPGFVLMGECG